MAGPLDLFAAGTVISAHPLALTADRRLDERRQGLLAGTWCLDEHEGLSPGQAKEIDRVVAAYPHLTDDAFVAENRDRWLA